jgi:sirohydrochlorin cobaltochelatase
MNLADTLADLLTRESRLSFGEIILTRNPEGRYSATHREDEGKTAGLEPLDSVRELREMAKNDAAGEYRPLKTAPGLKSGWITTADGAHEFLQRLDAIYPGLFATWSAYERGSFAPVPLRDTLGRQTGMYRFAGGISDEMALRIKSELCGRGCLRHIVWPIDPETPADRTPRDGGVLPLLCTEACTFAVNLARALVKEAYDLANPPAATEP